MTPCPKNEVCKWGWVAGRYMRCMWNLFTQRCLSWKPKKLFEEGNISFFHKQVQLALIEFYQTWKVDFQTLLIYGGVMALKLMYHSLVFALSDHRVIVGKSPWQCAFSKMYLYSPFSMLHLAYIASIVNSYTKTACGDEKRLFLLLHSYIW